MALFADLGLENVRVNQPNILPDGNYVGFVGNARIVKKKDGNVALVLTYTVNDDTSDENGNSQDEWRTFPNVVEIDGQTRFAQESDEKNAVFLKQRLLSFGYTDEDIPNLDPAELIGLPVAFVVASNNNYKNIRRVTKIESNGSSAY